MIRVTVELVSAIDPSRDRILGIGTITNVGLSEGRKTFADYSVVLSMREPRQLCTWRHRRLTLDEDVYKGIVEGFPREKLGAWDLLFRALRAVVGDRNP